MSLRTNLSTRPFYNERAVQAVLAVLILLVAAATTFNIVQLVRLGARDSEFVGASREADARTRTLRQQVSRVKASINAEKVTRVSDAAREANGVIDRRVFSWTQLLNQLETALPPEVRILAVQPRVADTGEVTVGVKIEGRSVPAIDQFMDSLERTGAFADLLARQEQEHDDGLIETVIEGRYQPTPRGAAEQRSDE